MLHSLDIEDKENFQSDQNENFNEVIDGNTDNNLGFKNTDEYGQNRSSICSNYGLILHSIRPPTIPQNFNNNNAIQVQENKLQSPLPKKESNKQSDSEIPSHPPEANMHQSHLTSNFISQIFNELRFVLMFRNVKKMPKLSRNLRLKIIYSNFLGKYIFDFTKNPTCTHKLYKTLSFLFHDKNE